MAAQQQHERNCITEFIDLYKNMPCLWDISSKSYKDMAEKRNAWEILTQKLREIEPNANEDSAKKKMEHLKFSYRREYKKIKESKNRFGSAADDIHKPNLWYFELMTFLDKKNEGKRTGVDSLLSEDDDEPQKSNKRKESRERILELKKQKLIDTAQDLLNENKHKPNSFGVYVGEQLDQIPSGQRDIAEKLISEVIFLAKTNNLYFDSKIETPSQSNCNVSHIYTQSHCPLKEEIEDI